MRTIHTSMTSTFQKRKTRGLIFTVAMKSTSHGAMYCAHYSRLVCLLGFWLRNTSLVKVGNPISDGIVFVFAVAIWPVTGQGFQNTKWLAVRYSQ